MTITAISRDYGVVPSIVRIVTDSPLEDIIRGGWLNTQAESLIAANHGEFEWNVGDAVLVQYPTGLINATTNQEIIGNVLTYVFPSFASLAPISPIYPFATGFVAHPGGGQTNAVRINPGMNTITTVATPGDSVIMPTDVLGQTTIVVNLGANSVDVFPDVGDNIDNAVANVAYNLLAGHRVIFIGTQITKWNSFADTANS